MCQKRKAVRLTNNLYHSKYEDPMVDECIVPFVERLNNEGIATVATCCGHGESVPYMTALLRPEKLPKLLDDLEADLGWKHLRGYYDPYPMSLYFEGLNPDFDKSGLIFVAIYAYAGYEEEYAEAMKFTNPFR